MKRKMKTVFLSQVGQLRREVLELSVSRCQQNFCGMVKLSGKGGGPMWNLERDKLRARLQDSEKQQKQTES